MFSAVLQHSQSLLSFVILSSVSSIVCPPAFLEYVLRIMQNLREFFFRPFKAKTSGAGGTFRQLGQRALQSLGLSEAIGTNSELLPVDLVIVIIA